MGEEKRFVAAQHAIVHLCWLLRCNQDTPLHVLHNLSEAEDNCKRHPAGLNLVLGFFTENRLKRFCVPLPVGSMWVGNLEVTCSSSTC